VEFPSLLVTLLTRFGRCSFAGIGVVSAHGREFDMFGGRRDGHCSILEDWLFHPDYQTEKLIPIADDMFNNRYVWDTTSGKVLFIDYSHRHGEETVIGESFEDFLGKVDVVPDDDARQEADG
jgi:hypothetical protein